MSAHVAESVLEETFIAEIGRPGEPVYDVATFVHSEKGAVKNVQLTFSGVRGQTMADVILSPGDFRAVLRVLGAVVEYLD